MPHAAAAIAAGTLPTALPFGTLAPAAAGDMAAVVASWADLAAPEVAVSPFAIPVVVAAGMLALTSSPTALHDDIPAALLHLPLQPSGAAAGSGPGKGRVARGGVGSVAGPGSGPVGGGLGAAPPPLASAGFTPTTVGKQGAIRATPQPDATLPTHTGSPPPARVDLGPVPFPIPDSNLPIALDSTNPLRDRLENAGRIAPGQDAHHKVPQGGPQNGGRDPREGQTSLPPLGSICTLSRTGLVSRQSSIEGCTPRVITR